MYSDFYYSKRKFSIIILITYLIFVPLLLNSIYICYKNKIIQYDVSTTLNYYKNIVSSVVINKNNNKNSIKYDDNEYYLSNLDYDLSTMDIDWNSLKKEKEMFNKEYSKVSNIVRSNSEVVSSDPFVLPSIKDTSFKGYMCLHTITSKTSYQWKFIHSGDFNFTTDSNGILKYDDYYVVAMGSYYSNKKIGSTFRISLDSGIVFDVIIGDNKADKDTDSLNMYRPKGYNRGEIIEFITACGQEDKSCCKYNCMSDYNRSLGDLSSLGFNGNVIKIEKLQDYTVVNYLYR